MDPYRWRPSRATLPNGGATLPNGGAAYVKCYVYPSRVWVGCGGREVEKNSLLHKPCLTTPVYIPPCIPVVKTSLPNLTTFQPSYVQYYFDFVPLTRSERDAN